jgi:hypothetical protein
MSLPVSSVWVTGPSTPPMAIPIYQRAGFEVAYSYDYWTRLAAH